MKVSLRSALGALFFASFLALFFQNCGGDFKITNLDASTDSSSLSLGTPGGNTAESKFIFDVGVLNNFFQAESITTQVDFQTDSKIKSVTIHSLDGTAKAGIDYLEIQKVLTSAEIQNRSFNLVLSSLYKELALSDKEFELVFDVTNEKGESVSVRKTIQIKSRYYKARYQKIKTKYSDTGVVCGQNSAGEVYCWGSGINSLDTADYFQQPYQIAASDGNQIDFESLQFASGEICLQQRLSDKVYCTSQMMWDATKRVLKVDESKPVLSGGHPEWMLNTTNRIHTFEVMNNENRITTSLLPTLIFASRTPAGVSFSKIISTLNSGNFVAVATDGTIYYVDTLVASSMLTRLSVPFVPNDIEQASGTLILLKDGRVYRLNPTGVTQWELITSPEPIVKWVGGTCGQSSAGRVYCVNSGTAFEFIYDLGVKKDKMVQVIRFDSAGAYSACVLDTDGYLNCRGEDSTQMSFSYNFVNSYWDPTPKSQEWVDALRVEFNSIISVNPLELSLTAGGTLPCTMDSLSLLTCFNKRVFGDFQIKSNSVRMYQNYRSGSYFRNFLMAQTLDGTWLVLNILNNRKNTWNPVYHKVLAALKLPLGPTSFSCPLDYTLSEGKCVLTSPVKLQFMNEVALINFPNAAQDLSLELALDQPLRSDLPVDLSIREANCASTNIISATCFPKLKQVCEAQNCGSNELEFAWANTPAGAPNRRFDWDYEFERTQLIIPAGQTKVFVKLRLSKDERHGISKLLNLSLASKFADPNLQVMNTSLIFFRRRMNPTVPGNEMSFSKLMSTNGFLMKRCFQCHNSTTMAGGYDMADYEKLIMKRTALNGQDYFLVKPGGDHFNYDPNGNPNFTVQSQMYKRVDPVYGNPNLQSMPPMGFLPQEEIDQFRNWLHLGGKNN